MKKILPSILTLVVLAYASCSLFHDDGIDTDSSSVEKPTLTLSVASMGSRTALPNVEAAEITSYKLTGDASGVDMKWTDNYGNTYTASSGIEWTSSKSGNKTLSADSSRTAYDVMRDDRIGIAAGTWNLTLTATKTSGGATATYVETKTVNIGSSGNQALTFNLSLSNLVTGSSTGALSIKVKLTEAVSAKLLTAKVYKVTDYTYDDQHIVNGKTTAAVKLTSSASGFEYSSTDETENAVPDEVTVASGTASFSAGELPFTVTSLPAGEYHVVFTFYDDTNNVLATWREAAYVSALGAVSTIEVGALDSTYPITYLQLFNAVPTGSGTIQATVLGTGSGAGITCSNQAKYSRSSSFELAAPSTGTTTYTFWRWVEVYSNGTLDTEGKYTVTFGEKKDAHVAGQIGPKYYMAQFFDADAYKQINHITLVDSNAINPTGTSENDMVTIVSNSADVKTAVGHTVKATAYTESTGSEDYAFKADVTWIWQYADSVDSTSWTPIPADSTDITNTPSGIRTSSLKIRPAYAGKFLRVYAVQTYKVSGTGTSADVSLNTVSDLTEAPSASTAAPVANGTLMLNNAKLSYSETAVIGSNLDVSKFSLREGVICDKVATDWVYADTSETTAIPATFASSFPSNAAAGDTTIVLTPSTGTGESLKRALAPYSSGLTKLPLTFSVAGYDDLVLEGDTVYGTSVNAERPTVEGGNVVNITVKAKAPVTTGDDSGDDSGEVRVLSLMDKDLVTYNHIRFINVAPAATSITKDDGKYPSAISSGLEYTFEADSAGNVPSTATWYPWKTTPGSGNYLLQEIDANSTAPSFYNKVFVRTAGYASESEADYIAPSEPVPIALGSSNIGTLVRLKEVQLVCPNVTRSQTSGESPTPIDIATFDLNNGKPKVGTKISVKLIPEISVTSGENTVALPITATQLVYEWTITPAATSADETPTPVTVRKVTKSVTAIPSSSEADFYTDSYTLASNATDLKIVDVGDSSITYQIDGSTVGSTLSVTVTPTYQTSGVGSESPEPTLTSATDENPTNVKSDSDTIAAGTLQFSEDFTISYSNTESTKKMIPGTRPNVKYVNITGNAKDSLGNVVLNATMSLGAYLYGTSYVFDSSATISEGETATTPLRFKATGFNDAIVNVTFAAGTSQIMTPAEVTAELLRTDVQNIPLGTIQFKDIEGADYRYYMFEYCTDSEITNVSVWQPVPNAAFSVDGTYYPDTNEYFVNHPVSVRLKATATVDGKVYYLNSEANKWLDAEGHETEVLAADVVAGTAIPLVLNESGIRYVGGHCALVTVKIQNDEDIDLKSVVLNIYYVQNFGKFSEFTWYLDDKKVAGPNGVYGFTVEDKYCHTESGWGKYILRLEAKSVLGDIYTTTVTYTKTN
ncbi:hypothetical protein [uncultured Treponema sp.]|uniref:hypothetical protein n=1 Tax=uncultured Treponema sp. TaxID=162155 RepID=UPI0025EB9CC0|nr:hypothetical protein [uncultured Treponema sp.]